jgi:AraC family transcriptional regulator of arabinose operon
MKSPSTQQQLSSLFFMLHDERRRPGPWGTASALNLLERILIVARTNAEGGEALVADSRISRVLQAIEVAGPPAPSLAELSLIAGLSPSRLAHVFKEQTGISIMAAVNRVRLSAAHLALQDSSASLQEAAERCGFASSYSFSKWYLKQTGLRPGEYQRRCASRLEGARPKLSSRT